MSEVKRFKAVINDKPYKPYAYCTEDTDGNYVRFEDYAALQQKMEAECANLRRAIDDVLAQRSALAAENAALKSFIDRECYCIDEEVLNYVWASNFVPATPATDAWRNSVRAEGVEMLAEHHLQKAEKYLAAGHEADSRSRIKMYNIAENFAAQLRSQEAK